MIKTTRKCKKCDQLIVLETDDFVIYNKVNYYHSDCYINHLVNKKHGAIEKSEARRIVEKLKIEGKEHSDDLIAKNHLFKWLQKQYDLVLLPKSFFEKMDSIFKGEYKGLDRPIPPADILDMWQRKWVELCAISAWKGLEDTHRLNYDLAIILSKATSYYKWKDQIQSSYGEIKEIVSTPKINYDVFCSPKNKSTADIENYIIEEDD